MRWIPLCANKQINGNKTCAILQITGGKDESNIVFMWKSDSPGIKIECHHIEYRHN